MANFNEIFPTHQYHVAQKNKLKATIRKRRRPNKIGNMEIDEAHNLQHLNNINLITKRQKAPMLADVTNNS